MARYKDYSCSQGKFIPIFFERQSLPGTFEYSLDQINNLKKSKLIGKLNLCQRAFSTDSLTNRLTKVSTKQSAAELYPSKALVVFEGVKNRKKGIINVWLN